MRQLNNNEIPFALQEHKALKMFVLELRNGGKRSEAKWIYLCFDENANKS